MAGKKKHRKAVDQRRYPRTPLKLLLSYKSLQKGRISNENQAVTENFGAGGLSLFGPEGLQPGQLVMLTLYLPGRGSKAAKHASADGPAREGQPAHILSRVAWCGGKGKKQHQLGLQFLDLNREHRKVLKAFLVEYGLDHPNSNLYI